MVGAVVVTVAVMVTVVMVTAVLVTVVVTAILVTMMSRVVMRRRVVGAMTGQGRPGSGERHGARHGQDANRPLHSADHVFQLLWFACAGNVTRERSGLQLDMSLRTSRPVSGAGDVIG